YIPGHVCIYVLAHGFHAILALLGKNSELFRIFLSGADGGIAFGGHCRMPLLVPLANRDEMGLQPLHGVAKRPKPGLVGRTVARRIVGRGMALRAISEELDQRRTR